MVPRSFTKGRDNCDTKLLWVLAHPPQSGFSHHPRLPFGAHGVWARFLQGDAGGAAALPQARPRPGLPATSQPRSLPRENAEASSTFSGAVPSGLLLVTGSLVTSLSPACEVATAAPRPDLRCFPPAAWGSPSPPPDPPGVRSVSRDLSKASVTNTTARAHPHPHPFPQPECLSLLQGRRPQPDPSPTAYSPAPALPPGSGITHSGRPVSAALLISEFRAMCPSVSAPTMPGTKGSRRRLLRPRLACVLGSLALQPPARLNSGPPSFRGDTGKVGCWGGGLRDELRRARAHARA